MKSDRKRKLNARKKDDIKIHQIISTPTVSIRRPSIRLSLAWAVLSLINNRNPNFQVQEPMNFPSTHQFPHAGVHAFQGERVHAIGKELLDHVD